MKDGTISVALDGMVLGGAFSGVEETILGLARTQAEAGRHQYRFFLPSSCPHDDPRGPRFKSQRVCIPRSRLMRLIWEQLQLPAAAAQAGCDLIHAPAYLAPLASSIPVVLTVYDLQALLFPELCQPLNRFNYRMMLPPSIRKARGIIVPSESVATDVTRLFPDALDKIAVIPIGLDPIFRATESGTHAETVAGLGIQGPFILFVGNMARNKNVPSLVRAFGIMKRMHGINHKLVLAGRHLSDYRKIVRTISEEELTEDVICTGYVPADHLLALYNAADVFAFPSLYEGFGLPPLEAMACGTPVACSNAGGLRDTVGSAAELMDSTNEAAMAATIAGLIQNRARQTELSKMGFERVKAFTRNNAMLQTESFYEKIMQSQ